jgi:hypothetical protein
MSEAIDSLLQHPGLWRGKRPAQVEDGGIPTGFSALDALLPGGGWPLGALTEILPAREGIGALRLAMPALARLSHEGRWLAWIAPPYIPYAPALAGHGVQLSRVLLVHPRTSSALRVTSRELPPESGAPNSQHATRNAQLDSLWAIEQALRSGTCGAVLAWPTSEDERSLRRLQLAAEEGRSWGLLFRDPRCAALSSPAALRLAVAPAPDDGLAVHILKRRGGWPTGPVTIDLAKERKENGKVERG